MDLRRLQSLVAIADHGSFSAAARALHTVQSNVSSHVGKLEAELGVSLIDRPSGDLTEAGRLVVSRARRIQLEIDALTGDVASLSDEVVGRVRLGVIGTTARWLGAHLLDACALDTPKVDLFLHDGTTSALVRLLLAGELEAVVVHLPVHDRDLLTEPLFSEETILIAPSDHHLSGRESVQLSELEDEPLLLSAPGTPFRTELDARAAKAGTSLTAKAEVDGLRLAASLAFAGFGATILPASAAPAWVGGDWCSIRIDDGIKRTVGLVRLRRASPSRATRTILDIVRNVVSEHAPEEQGLEVLITP